MMKIDKDLLVELDFELRDAEGEVLEEGGSPITYLHGYENICPGLERALEGLEAGTRFDVSLEPGDAFGDYDVADILPVGRDQFPSDAELVPGDWVTVVISDEKEEDSEVDMIVKEISPETILLDANHPLAGRKLTFQGEILNVRQASEDEIEEMRGE